MTMKKISPESENLVDARIRAIAEICPGAVTETTDSEGNTTLGIDFDALRQELSATLISDAKERYQFTWPNKRKSIILASEPTDSALRPVRERSAGRDGAKGGFDSQNVYIEGDNLEALKVLRTSYLGKVKMIYIDPPYNTGNDFIYNDDFEQSEDEYLAESGQKDDAGKKMVVNKETNGRYHTNWLNMIYPRLRLARDFLREDGVIFISIDDHEAHNLRKVCDEVFGAQNFVAQLVWERAYSPKNDAKYVSNSHDYILIFARNLEQFVIGRLERTEEANKRYINPDNDPRGVWKPSDMSVKTYSASGDYPITTPSGRVVEPPAGRCWRLSRNSFRERLEDNRIWFGPNGDGVPCIKRFLSELRFDGMAPTSILFYKEVGHSQEGAQEVSKLLDGGFFSGPKPVRLLLRLLTLANLAPDSLVMDFFSGSGTLAHALMEYNRDNSKNCRYILVQLPEVIDEDTSAYRAGYRSIYEIGQERIRRAGAKIKEEILTKNALFIDSKASKQASKRRSLPA